MAIFGSKLTIFWEKLSFDLSNYHGYTLILSACLKCAQFHKTYRFWVISYFHFLWNFRLSSISTILKFQEKLQKVQIEFWWDKLSHSFPFTFRAWVETTDIPQLLICFTFPSFFGLFNQSFCWVTFSSYKGYFEVGLWIMKSK